MPKKKKAKDSKSISEEDIRINCDTTTDSELEEWIITTRKVLIVLADENGNTKDKIYQDFVLDLQRLIEAGRITDEDYENILESL